MKNRILVRAVFAAVTAVAATFAADAIFSYALSTGSVAFGVLVGSIIGMEE